MPTKKFDSGADEWSTHLKANPDKIREGANKPIEKIKAIIKEKARNESITEDEALRKYPVLFKMLKGYQLSKEKTEKALLIENGAGSSKYDAGVDRGKEKYERMRRECFYPLYGSRKDGVKGLIFLGLMALCGDRSLRKCLKPELDGIITGKPLAICPPEKLKEFRKELRFQIAQSGAVIIKDGFSVDVLGSQNETLNRLANQYRSDKLALFKPGVACSEPRPEGRGASPRLGSRSSGTVASHIDFIAVEIPNPAKPGEMMKRLGLDIQVSVK